MTVTPSFLRGNPLRWGATLVAFGSLLWLALTPMRSAPALGPEVFAFTDRYCSNCHNEVDKEGGLDLTSFKDQLTDPNAFLTWVRVHDRVQNGEMPPKEKKRPDPAAAAAFTKSLSSSLVAFEDDATTRFGRTQRRRLNRVEFENSLQNIFQAPWILVKDLLPEDGVAANFNKVSRALDVSPVHVERYLNAAETAIKQVLAVEYARPATKKVRYWARENITLADSMGHPSRGKFPVLDSGPDLPVITRTAPLTVGDKDSEKREHEAMGWTGSHFQPALQTHWNNFYSPVAGRYNFRFSAYTIWVGPNGTRHPTQSAAGTTPKGGDSMALAFIQPEWAVPNHYDISAGRRNEPLHVYARLIPNAAHRLGTFELTPEPQVFELPNVWLNLNEFIITDAARFFRSRPFTLNDNYTNKLAQPDGQPAVAFRWMEIEGPLYDESSRAGYRLLFGDLPLKKVAAEASGVRIEILAPSNSNESRGGRGGRGAKKGGASAAGELPGRAAQRAAILGSPIPGGVIAPVMVDVESANPQGDGERLLRTFMSRIFRRPVAEPEVQRFLGLFKQQLTEGNGFATSLLATYTAVIASEGFVYLDEDGPGKLDDFALATRLAFLLGNSEPDATLRAVAAKGELRQPAVLRREVDRLLADAKSDRFITAFLDYWLDLRKIEDTAPDVALYSDYFIDDSLTEAALAETRMFFGDLVRRNLPARTVVDSDFTFLNERLATHYGIPDIDGVAMRRVALPAGSVRGGLMTQASVLKVTANGTTTSPVLRGKWVMERILGYEAPPPPAAVPAVEPDVRGATTIRQQLDKHRADESCAMCHRNIDPPGFALESFDVFGGFRTRYRAVNAAGQTPEVGFGHNGWPLTYFYALPVDPSGQLADGRAFNDVRSLKAQLLNDETQIARNIARQLMVYATGAPVRFSDRATLERILEKTRASGYGIRNLLIEIIQSDQFLNK